MAPQTTSTLPPTRSVPLALLTLMSTSVLFIAVVVASFFNPSNRGASSTVEAALPLAPIRFVHTYDIQGASHISPLDGILVAASGIVTAVAKKGFYLQDVDGDGDLATSDAVFVYTKSSPNVSVSDFVNATGTVKEYVPGGKRSNNLAVTQIDVERDGSVTVLSSDNELPKPVVIGSQFVSKYYLYRSFPSPAYRERKEPQAGIRVPPNKHVDRNQLVSSFEPLVDAIDFYESLEGMLVTVRDPVTVSTRSRFGELWVVADAGADADLGPRGSLPIAPGNFNPERIQLDVDQAVFQTKLPDLPIGTKLSSVTGVVSYNFGNFEVIPVAEVEVVQKSKITPMKTTFASSAHASRTINVASMNVLNLDPTDDVAKFDSLAKIIVDSLRFPDIVALQEVQDENGPAKGGTTSAALTLQTLVDAVSRATKCSILSKLSGCPTYAFQDNEFIGKDTSGGQPGGNIRVAFLYRTDRMKLDAASLNSVVDSKKQQTDPNNAFYRSRLPLAARFVHLWSERAIEVINVHFSSKGGSVPLFGAVQPTESRQEDVEVNGSLDERRKQAEAVAAYVASKTPEDRARVVVTGDFNEFEFISPLKTLQNELTLMTTKIDTGLRYTYNFQGNAQTLDHFLVGSQFAETASVENVHANVEFPDAASDHEPIILRVNL